MTIANHQNIMDYVDLLLASLDGPVAPLKKTDKLLEKKKDAAIGMSIRDSREYAIIGMGFGTYQIYPVSQVDETKYKIVWRTGGN